MICLFLYKKSVFSFRKISKIMIVSDHNRVRELQQLIFGNNTDPKLKFSVKILRILQFAQSSPKDIQFLGAAWCMDGKHFITHSQILGKFLGLKSNTINTNFRSHCFFMKNYTNLNDFIMEFRDLKLPDVKNWKRRINVKFNFTIDSTEEDANAIPIFEEKKQGIMTCCNTTIFPQNTLTFLRQHDDIQSDIQKLFSKCFFDDDWKKEFLSRSTSDWLSISTSLNINPKILLKAVKKNIRNNELIGIWKGIKVNLLYLLLGSNGLSQRAETISFVEFLELELRFGFLNQIAQSIYELSGHGSKDTQESLFRDKNNGSEFSYGSYPFDMYDFGNSQNSIFTTDNNNTNRPCFAIWFFPSNDYMMGINYMKTNNLKWIVRTASTHPNCYTLQMLKSDSIGQEDDLIATHIVFDALSEDEKLSAELSQENSFKKAPNWKCMIENCLRLSFPLGCSEPVSKQNVRHVTADEVIANTTENDDQGKYEHTFNI